ncbi:TCP-1/cpn60 chaperonin family domain-containing protein [Ditylenchus destructor]|uniref:TCP-1/cpn60 chaperonin family domain-containing protein n=1 Tax=Ditylenchus destructor TaxID=166010 RepID=A0AAD4QV80_9BILA|nr:TCP-1/cpn60 chaperonin family domain-containing protein [Ditylenchus destructor]
MTRKSCRSDCPGSPAASRSFASVLRPRSRCANARTGSMTRCMQRAPAVEEGIVSGGGTALLYASHALDGLRGANEDQTRGIDIVRKALPAPLRQIAENAGYDGGVVAARLLDGNDRDMGFNAQTEIYENLIDAGVIDPTLVARSALQDAASVAGLLLMTEAAIVDVQAHSPIPASGGAY